MGIKACENKTKHSTTGTAAFIVELETMQNMSLYTHHSTRTHTHTSPLCSQPNIRASSFFWCRIITTEEKQKRNHGFCSRTVPESSTWPQRCSGRGGGMLSTQDGSRQSGLIVSLSCLKRPGILQEISLIIAEEHWVSCLNRTNLLQKKKKILDSIEAKILVFSL